MNKKSHGYTLIELVIIVAILGIIAMLAAPRLFGFTNIAEARVCLANRNTVERM